MYEWKELTTLYPDSPINKFEKDSEKNGSGHGGFYTRNLVVVVVVDPSTIFTFKDPDENLDDLVYEAPSRIVRHKIV